MQGVELLLDVGKIQPGRLPALTVINSKPGESTLQVVADESGRNQLTQQITLVAGGIRANLRTGDLVYSDLFDVSPFDNYPMAVTLTGAQIAEMLRGTGWTEKDIGQHRKADEQKERMAAKLRKQTTVGWKWIAEKLHMGHWRSAANAVRLHA